MTYRKQPSLLHLACLSLYECHLVCGTPPRPSRDLSTTFFGELTSAMHTWMMFSSPVLHRRSTFITCAAYSNASLHMVWSSTPTNVFFDKVQAIRDFPLPKSDQQLRQFMGLSHNAELMHPLHDLLPNRKSTSATLNWSENATAAFNATKDALANATLLTYPRPDAPTSVMTDASDLAVSAVLQQYSNGTWHPISFFSKKINRLKLPSTGNYWLSTSQSVIFAISLKVVTFTCGRIISH